MAARRSELEARLVPKFEPHYLRPLARSYCVQHDLAVLSAECHAPLFGLVEDSLYGLIAIGDAHLRVLVLGFMIDREQPCTVYPCPQRSLDLRV